MADRREKATRIRTNFAANVTPTPQVIVRFFFESGHRSRDYTSLP